MSARDSSGWIPAVTPPGDQPQRGSRSLRRCGEPSRRATARRSSAPTCSRARSSASSRCRCRWPSRSRWAFPPQHGLYTAIVAGAIVALLGGCKFQVTGPTAAFVVNPRALTREQARPSPGLLTAGLLAGFLLVAMGVARLGNLIETSRIRDDRFTTASPP